jgi:hypothetical protein
VYVVDIVVRGRCFCCFLLTSKKQEMERIGEGYTVIDLTKFLVGDGVKPSRAAQPVGTFEAVKLFPDATWTVEGFKSDSVIVGKRGGLHSLVATADRAFNDHLHLALSPDDLLLPLLQQLAIRRNALNKGTLHAAKKQLVVRRDDFSIGDKNKDLPWNELFADFRSQIHAIAKQDTELWLPNFSTTTPLIQSAYDVSLMDAFQSAFSYHNMFMCGIASVELLGTKEDWSKFRSLAKLAAGQLLATGGDEVWHEKLCNTIDSIVDDKRSVFVVIL